MPESRSSFERGIYLKKKIAIALGLILIVAVVIGAVIKSNSDSSILILHGLGFGGFDLY
ncbi:MAG TPA: hypothetical protein GXX59_02675 [Syntrophomonadaceae bacterium]|nr:hypothetical protein [Syntrophomonadaceae bacterium]